MKAFLLIMTILFFMSTLAVSALYLMKNREFEQLGISYKDLDNKYSALSAELVKSQNECEDLRAMAYLKSFPSRSSLETWAKDNTKYNSQTAYSEDAIRLINIARDDGYWLGLAISERITGTNGKITLQVPVYPYYVGSNLYTYNVAIVGESDVYAVDPATGTALKLDEILGKWGWPSIQ